MSTKMDGDFAERLQQACTHARVPYRPADLANRLDINRQTVHRWMNGGEPNPQMLFKIADSLEVDARWLATNEGEMIPTAQLRDTDPREADLLERYRDADPRWQLSLQLLACLATEDQFEVAGDVNVVLARIFSKKPGEMKYVSNQRMEHEYKFPPGKGLAAKLKK